MYRKSFFINRAVYVQFRYRKKRKVFAIKIINYKVLVEDKSNSKGNSFPVPVLCYDIAEKTVKSIFERQKEKKNVLLQLYGLAFSTTEVEELNVCLPT